MTAKLFWRAVSLLLCVCLLAGLLPGMRFASAAENSTTVYFLNSAKWDAVGVYAYNTAPAEALGSWPGQNAVPAPELGEYWVKMTVPALTPFSIIFFNKAADGQRAELLIPSEHQIYVAGARDDDNVAAFAAAEEAELAMNMGDESKMTTVYFYNSRGWGDLYGYVFREEQGEYLTVGSGWPGNAAERAPELGENWWKLPVPRLASEEDPFHVTFTDGMNRTEQNVTIYNPRNVYAIATGRVYASPEEAQAAASLDGYDLRVSGIRKCYE